MIFLAVIIPFLSFLLRGKVIAAIVCLVLQITLIGWLPAAIWAIISLQSENAERRHQETLKVLRDNRVA